MMYPPSNQLQTPHDETQEQEHAGYNCKSKKINYQSPMPLEEGFSLPLQKLKAKKRKSDTIHDDVVHTGRLVRSTNRTDRHSKVYTARGPRDRRVRLSPQTAIQFFDVQERLGYDRPSKAIDWLINEARAAIDELVHEQPHHTENQQIMHLNHYDENHFSGGLNSFSQISDTSEMFSHREPLQSSFINYSPISAHFPGFNFRGELSDITTDAATPREDEKHKKHVFGVPTNSYFLHYED